MAVIIEFIGLPGSGKTTLQEALIRSLREHDVNAISFERAQDLAIQQEVLVARNSRTRNALRKFFFDLVRSHMGSLFKYSTGQILAYQRFVFTHPRLLESFPQNSNHLQPPGQKRLDWIFDLFSGYQSAKQFLHEDTVLVMDEGFCHKTIALWGLFHNQSLAQSQITEYLARSPLPHLLVVVQIDKESCVQRVEERGMPYPGILGATGRNGRLQRLHQINNFINSVALAARQKGVHVIEVDNSGTSRSMTANCLFEEVISALKTHLPRTKDKSNTAIC